MKFCLSVYISSGYNGDQILLTNTNIASFPSVVETDYCFFDCLPGEEVSIRKASIIEYK